MSFMALTAGAQLIGTGMDIYQAVQGAKLAKQAEKDLIQLQSKRDQLSYQDKMAALQVGQRGEDLMSANMAQAGSQILNTLQDTGAAGVIGGVGALAQAQADQNLQIGAQLSERAYENELRKAINAQQVENMNTGYKMANAQQDIQGAQSAYVQGMNQRNQAIASAAQGMMGFAAAGLTNADLYKKAAEQGAGAEQGAAFTTNLPEGVTPPSRVDMGTPQYMQNSPFGTGNLSGFGTNFNPNLQPLPQQQNYGLGTNSPFGIGNLSGFGTNFNPNLQPLPQQQNYGLGANTSPDLQPSYVPEFMNPFLMEYGKVIKR